MPTLGSFVAQVRPKLGNRTDIDDRISQWLLESYREIYSNYDLETLEETDESMSTVAGTDGYDYPDTARAIKSIILLQGVQPIYPKKKDIRVVRKYQVTTQGVPAIWAPFANKFIFRPTPDLVYPMVIDFWIKPEVDTTSTVTINATEVLLPDDWYDVLIMGATERGHHELQETDKAQATHQILFGDPNPSKGFPGWIKEKLNRGAAENAVSDYGIRPRVRSYGRGR